MKKTTMLALFVSALVTGCMAEDHVDSQGQALSERDYQANVHTAIRHLGIDNTACTIDARRTKSCVVVARTGEVLSTSTAISQSTELEVCTDGACGAAAAGYDCDDGECSCDTVLDCILMSNEMCEGELVCDENGCTCEY